MKVIAVIALVVLLAWGTRYYNITMRQVKRENMLNDAVKQTVQRDLSKLLKANSQKDTQVTQLIDPLLPHGWSQDDLTAYDIAFMRASYTTLFEKAVQEHFTTHGRIQETRMLLDIFNNVRAAHVDAALTTAKAQGGNHA